MARRRAPAAPSITDQRLGFRMLTRGGRFHTVISNDPELGPAQLVAKLHDAAAREAARRGDTQARGRPPDWDRLVAAAQKLEAEGVRLSDAPGSRAVGVLHEFLAKRQRGKSSRNTAAELAGTLLALGRSFQLVRLRKRRLVRKRRVSAPKRVFTPKRVFRPVAFFHFLRW